METLDVKIEGMACGDCIAKIHRAMGAIQEVKIKKCSILKPGLGRAVIDFDPALTSISVLNQAIVVAGFQPQATGGR